MESVTGQNWTSQGQSTQKPSVHFVPSQSETTVWPSLGPTGLRPEGEGWASFCTPCGGTQRPHHALLLTGREAVSTCSRDDEVGNESSGSSIASYVSHNWLVSKMNGFYPIICKLIRKVTYQHNILLYKMTILRIYYTCIMWNVFIPNLYLARYLAMYKEYPVSGGDCFVLWFIYKFFTT